MPLERTIMLQPAEEQVFKFLPGRSYSLEWDGPNTMAQTQIERPEPLIAKHKQSGKLHFNVWPSMLTLTVTAGFNPFKLIVTED